MLILRYLKYLLHSSHYKGHGIHSPHTYKFVREILFIKETYGEFDKIKKIRNNFLHNHNSIEITDLGAGSRVNGNNCKRKISHIAATSSVSHKYGKLLSRMIKFYHPNTILEIGTSLGIGSAYLAKNMTDDSKLYTIEGDKNLVNIAKTHLSSFKHTKIHLINENFDTAIPNLINSTLGGFDFVFFDGNHTSEATIRYFNQLLGKINNETIFVFDDIHWSADMEKAWEYIISHNKTKVCIDLFRFGIVFFRKELSEQNYVIKYF